MAASVEGLFIIFLKIATCRPGDWITSSNLGICVWRYYSGRL